MNESNDRDLRFHLYVTRGSGGTISADISEDDLLKVASESPLFRDKLNSLLRHLTSPDPQVGWLKVHLGRMDSEAATPNNEPGVSELIEMLKLQTKVNESYARLAILLGEMYVEKAQR